MNIDWSKAPEGATHKETSCPDGFWYRFDFERNTAEFCPMHSTRWSSTSPASAYSDGSMDQMVARPPESIRKELADQQDQTRQEIIDLARDKCGLSVDSIRQLATLLAAEGYKKFEIVEGDV